MDYNPDLNIVSEWDGDYYSSQYTRRNRGQPVDLGAFADAVETQYQDRRDLPQMVGAAHQGPNTVVYGTSGPSWPRGARRGQPSEEGRKRIKNDVIQSRLHTFPTDSFLQTSGSNPAGNCCEYVTLKEHIPGQRCILRLVTSQARLMKTGRAAEFCARCVRHAQEMANRFPGLRIWDSVANRFYESQVTREAVRLKQAGMSDLNVNTYLTMQAATLPY
ncbi:hypothetical protein DFH09DRAFT_628409 [Mycena vulgaris]|nr:hypothetical protein DFH09DRAFT_628409 [Mycena vulgaris]